MKIVSEIAGLEINKRYVMDAPKGVSGRNSDNSKIKEIYGWEPEVSLRDGLSQTYSWIYRELLRRKL